MATPKRRVRPLRPLILLLVLIALVFGGIGANAQWGKGSMTPGLALDLEGGTQLILTPSAKGAEISDSQIQEAIRIMRQRVNATGVSEAEISRQGGSNIVVKLPGDPSQETIDLVQSSAQLRFRPVLTASGPEPINPDALEQQKQQQQQQQQGQQGDTGPDQQQGQQQSDQQGDQASSESPSADPAGGTVPRTTDDSSPASQDAQGDKDAQSDSSGSQSDQGQDEAGQDSTEPSQDSTAAPQEEFSQEEIEKAAREAADVNGDGKISDEPQSEPENASDTAWMTEKVLLDFYTLDCTDPANRAGGGASGEPDQPVAACSQDGTSKFVLGPTEIEGTQVASANSALETTSQGAVTNNYIVQLSFNDQGAQKFAAVTKRLAGLASSGQNRFAIVLDGLVISAPSVTEEISGGQAQISGSDADPFTQDETISLANQLNYGALPITFELRSQSEISATLGTVQLERGLIAGLIGLLLVVVYSVIQYRGLALVTLLSLLIAGTLSYGSITGLSELIGYRLSLAGVAGLIIAIGITADSFIVYFERIRDEVREGRRLQDAVDLGWSRARRTVLASDAVNLLAAIVLYVLSVGGVRGFAFTLGLTTVIDVLVVVLFTHPMVQLLVRTKFFGNGHRLSGLDPVHLGSKVPIYRGRGRLRSGESIAERRRAAEKAAAAEQASEAGETDEAGEDPPEATEETGTGTGRQQDRDPSPPGEESLTSSKNEGER